MAGSGITATRREPCGCAVVEGLFGVKEIVCETHTPPRECPWGLVRPHTWGEDIRRNLQ